MTVALDLPAEVREYLSWLSVERGRSPRTVEAYARDLRRWTTFLAARERTVASADRDDVTDFVDGLRTSGLAPSTVKRATVAVRALHRFLADEGDRATDPAARVRPPPVPATLPKALTEAQVARLLDAVVGDDPRARRDRALLEVLYGTGARIAEVVGLGLGDVDLGARLIRLTGKGDKDRIVPLGRSAAASLQEWLAPGGRPDVQAGRRLRMVDADAVLCNLRGGRLTRQGAWGIVRGHAERVGLGAVVSPHVLRHSCATHLLRGGADLRSVQELLGHASVSTTQVYTLVTADHLRAVYDRAHPRATAGA